MKYKTLLCCFIIMLACMPAAMAQAQPEVVQTMKRFHQLLVRRDFILENYLHKDLSYGHSSGWIENREMLLKNNREGILVYNDFKEDSVDAVVSGNIAHIRFIADIDVVLNGNKAKLHLKVLEIWVREGRRWKLYARQAIKP